MSKHKEAASVIAQMVLDQGNRNGQRWLVDESVVAEYLAAHYPEPEPVKKKATKKAVKEDDDGPDAEG